MATSSHKFALGSRHHLSVTSQFGLQLIQRRAGKEQLGSQFQGDLTGHRMEEADAKVTGHCLDGLVKQTMGHGRVQQRTDHAAMNEIIVPL
jgi:hypothetical protein